MAVIVTQVNAPISADHSRIIDIACKKVGITLQEGESASVYKVSLDARKQNNIRLAASVYLQLDEAEEKRLCGSFGFCSYVQKSDFTVKYGSDVPDGRIVVVGFGPCGMFAALTLAEHGYRPLVLERGGAMEERCAAVEKFWQDGIFSSASNVQFGEGGAGTFSDGKLTTRINDSLCRRVLEKLTEFGAPEEILTMAKPHIGTDKLRSIVRAIRMRITELGGEVRFNSCVTNIGITNGRISSVSTADGEIKTACAVFAVGHSARDTFEMLLKNGILIQPKPFSVGARIEHTQLEVDRSLYGKYYDNPILPKGEYQLSHRHGDRAVYTFCMCPGGYVVPSQSEAQSIVTNGMSEFSRSGTNANSALVVSVSSEDFGSEPLAGVDFARSIERRAYNGQDYRAPAVSVGFFRNKKTGFSPKAVKPTYALGVYEGDFEKLFPPFVTDMMREGLDAFSRKMKCFGDPNALLTAPETRTSSPVRISRGEDMMSLGTVGLYPCGEGAGYAGGIISAAVDGVHCAMKIMEKYKAD